VVQINWTTFVVEKVVPNLNDLLRIFQVVEAELRTTTPEYKTTTEARRDAMV
jgi:hypothetical protein